MIDKALRGLVGQGLTANLGLPRVPSLGMKLGAWTPARLSGVIAWFDASVAASIRRTGSGQVQSWLSVLGNLEAVQTNGTLQPIYSTTARNGLPGVTFDGADDVLSFSTFSNLPVLDRDATILAVAYSATSGFRVLTGYSGGTATGGTSRSFGVAGGGGSAPLTDTQPALFCQGAPNIGTTSGYSWVTADRVVVAVIGSNLLEMTVDGSAPVSNTGTMATVATAGGIGWDGGATGGTWSGTVQEVIYVNRKLTTPERQKAEGYLAWKWNLAASLPASHPYKIKRPQA